ncbi:MAG: LPS-assembly protein LptD [Pseudomonadota bacterium]
MRLARTPQALCGGSCISEPRESAWLGRGARALVRLLAVAAAAALPLLATDPAAAQDPSKAGSGKGEKPSFAKPKGGIFGKLPKVDNAQPLYLQGDELIYDSSGNKVTARGNVEIFHNNYILTANEVVYDQGANTLTALGNVTLKEPNGNVVRADRYTLTDDFRDGFVQSLSIVARDDTRIAGEQAIRRDGNVTEFHNGKFTPCKSKEGVPPLWCISAKRVIHDQQEATITYQDAQFELFGVPVLYTPYFQHPDPSVKRKSGFLLPSYMNSENLGFGVEVPYYFALAPNYDFTFHPMYLTQQGVLWQGEWRHRLDTGEYWVKFGAIDQDPSNLPGNPTDDKLDGWRGTLETKGKFALGSWWNAGWDVTLESDDTFRRFYKYDNILLTDRVNQIYLGGQSDRSYMRTTLYHFGGLLLNDPPSAESRAHPIIDHNYVFDDPVLGGELRWDTNVLSFSRDDIALLAGSQGINRAVTEVKWRRQLTDPVGITYTPFAELRGDIYQLNDYVDPDTGILIADETVTRGRTTAGMMVAYPWVANSPLASHIIEPIGQIITRQDSLPQRRLPNEDAKSLIFDDTNLFDTDKFSGLDRLETGTRVNAGLQYTFQANNGGYARLLAGQSFQIAGENPYANPGRDVTGAHIFSPVNGLENDNSDYVIGAYLAPFEGLQLISQSRLQEDDFDLMRQNLYGRVALGPVEASALYTFAARAPEIGRVIDQQDITSHLAVKLTDTWSVLGSARYDIGNDDWIQDSIGLKYADDCFVLTASYIETFVKDAARDLEPDRTVMLRFELKHLGEFRYKTDALDHVFGDDQPPR